jgi:hypothetical protein
MDPTREIKRDGYVYILKTNRRQYRCVSCSSTFSIDSYCTRSGHSGKCRNSKNIEKTVKKPAKKSSLILKKEVKKMLQPGVPFRNPTKHFKKDKTPTESNASNEEDQYYLSNEFKYEEEALNISIIEESINSSLLIPTTSNIKNDIKAINDRIDQKRREKHLKNQIKAPKKK